ncbi:MAG: 6-bladed beta-propeller [Acidobacteriota bacterium]|nr:6-bladed beta-propeller [Acidobacteriota bacterium]
MFVSSKEPLYGDLKYELREDLRIGSESDPQQLFHTVLDVDADASGNIYVVDARNIRIQIFNSSGQYVRTVGRKGQGPGEFEYPFFIRLDEEAGRMLVIDRWVTLKIFDLNGRFHNSFVVGVMKKIFPCRNGHFLAILQTASEDYLAYTQALCRIDSSGSIISKIAEHPFSLFVERLSSGATYGQTTHYELGLRLAKMANETFVFGHSGAYELTLIEGDGKVVHRFRKEEPSPRFTAEERRRLKAPGEKKPYFFELLTDSLDRIYVQRNMAYGRIMVEIREKEVDVFDRTGRFLYRTRLPANTRAIRDGLLYCWELNEEEGMEYVKRYRILNWDRIVRAN